MMLFPQFWHLRMACFSFLLVFFSCDYCVQMLDIDNVCNKLLLFTVKLVH
jgi:hypothetical protein